MAFSFSNPFRKATPVPAGGGDAAVLPQTFQSDAPGVSLQSGDEQAAGPIAAEADDGTGASAPTRKPKPPRLVSLDAFRGLTIFGMLLVNNISLGGQTPAQLKHADWANHVNVADLVFPWFLFIVGVAIPYAAASARRKRLPTLQYDLKALWRAASLVGLGCVIDSFLAHKIVLDLGVLQVIGLAYFVTVLLGGFFHLTGRLVMAAVLLFANYLLIMHYPVPGVGAGVFTEKENVIDYLNKTYLTAFDGGFFTASLKGILSVIPTTAMVLIGSAVGDLLRRKKLDPYVKFGILEVCGAGLVSAGMIASHFIAYNKPDWTASYLLYCAGWACIGLGITYLVVDMTPGKTGAKIASPLLVLGTNAIVAYVAPILTKAAVLWNLHFPQASGKPLNGEEVIQNWFYAHAGRIQGGWLYTFAYIGFWWCILLVLYRKRWFLRV